jgi:hypothetical protein
MLRRWISSWLGWDGMDGLDWTGVGLGWTFDFSIEFWCMVNGGMGGIFLVHDYFDYFHTPYFHCFIFFTTTLVS